MNHPILISLLSLLLLVSDCIRIPPEKYEFISWDDDSKLNGKIVFMFQTTNQPLSIIINRITSIIVNHIIHHE